MSRGLSCSPSLTTTNGCEEVPSDETNGVGVCDVGDQYAKGTRSSYALVNWIRSEGYRANPYPGPSASALALIPPAIASGLGELGKHGSLISRYFGSGVRLAGVTTDMPLIATSPDRFGADEFCATCQVCTTACPPGAIATATSKWCAGWSVGMLTSISAFPIRGGGLLRNLHRGMPMDAAVGAPKLLATMARRLGQ